LATQRTVLGHPVAESMVQPGYGVSHIPMHYADKAQDGAHSATDMGHSSRNLA